ncbi:MAG TPA: hypothetical protein VGM43_19955 [Bryobacteraceae bacterium]|jgi:hypothetical protein
MTVYSLVLFVHVVAVLTLFSALSLEALSLFRLRRASGLPEIRLWIEPVPGLPSITGSSLLVTLLSGIYLAVQMSAFGGAWPKVTIAALFLIAPLAAISGRRMRAIHRASASTAAMISDLRGRLRDPLLKISLDIRIAVVLGIVLLMDAKPGLWESVGIVGTSVALGLLAAFLVSSRASSTR